MMKSKGDKDKYIFYSNEDPTVTIFEQIKDWVIHSQIEFTFSLDEPKRTELFNIIIKSVNDLPVKQYVLLAKQRFDDAGYLFDGFTATEIQHYQKLFSRDFIELSFIINSENFTVFIEDKIRELLFYCKRLDRYLNRNDYEYLEDNERVTDDLTEAERYKLYLENLLSRFVSQSFPTQTKISIAAYAIMHVYLAMFQGKPITKQNKDDLAKKYGYKSGQQLRNEFTFYQNEENRMDLHTNNKRSAKTHLQRFKDILPLLKNENIESFNKASEDLLNLEIIYNKHY